jgi:PST family polysaccharide transporter
VEQLRAAALRGTVWSALQQAGDRGIRIITFLVLARLVQPDAFGVVALAVVFIEFGQIFLNQGLTAAIVQREDLRAGHLDSAFWGNLLFGVLFGSLVWLTSGAVADLAHEPAIAPVLGWLALTFPISALSSVQDALLRRRLDFRALTLRSLVSQLIGGLVALVMAFKGAGVWSLVGLELVQRSVAAMVLWTVSDWRPGFRVSVRRYVELLSFGISIMGVAFLEFMKNRSDYYLVGSVLGAYTLGFYSVARQLVHAVTSLVNGSVAQVIWPTFSRLQLDAARLSRAISRATEMLALVAWPVYLGGAAIAPLLVPVALGEGWNPTVPVAQAFLLKSSIQVVTSPLMTAITAVGEARLRFRLELLSTGAILLAILLALPHGINAVAWAYLGASTLVLPVQLAVAFRKLPLEPRSLASALSRPLLACLIMVAVVLRAGPILSGSFGTIGALVLNVVLGVITYTIALAIIAPELIRRVRLELSRLHQRDTAQ